MMVDTDDLERGQWVDANDLSECTRIDVRATSRVLFASLVGTFFSPDDVMICT